MRLLFIAPEFNTYHLEIIKKLESNGHSVNYIKEKRVGFFWDILHRTSRSVYCYLQKKFLLNSLVKLKLKDRVYSHLFIIRGEFVSDEVINYLNREFKFDKRISYQWDSVKNNPQTITHFNNGFFIFSFDPDDCNKFGYHYLPLFYIKEGGGDTMLSYDLSFVGVYTDERIDLIKKINKLYAKTNKIKIKIKINLLKYISLKYFSNKLDDVPSHFFTFSNLDYLDVLSIMEKSHIVLDISHSTQSGLTMRTFETIGCGRKLLTNNQLVCNEKFYNKNMIETYDIMEFSLDIDKFIKNKINPYNKKDYSIDAWLSRLLRSD